MGTACEEYLDVINTVVRDAYHYTYPQIVLADKYVKSFGRHGTLPVCLEDSRWRRNVMERAFTRMCIKDRILRRKHSEWELHPDFEAKRFFKYRESADWVLQIYSDDSTEQHRSRTALQSLEKFLDSDLDRIKKKQLIQLFGWSAGEGYDRLQIPRTVKSEPEPEIVDLTQTPSRSGTKRKRAGVEGSDSDRSIESEPSSPIPLFTPMSSPPARQPTTTSIEKPIAVSTIVMSRKEEIPAKTDKTVLDKPKVLDTDTVSRKQEASAAQAERTMLENMLSKVPWLPSLVMKLREKYPKDRFEIVDDHQSLKLKCHDCPKNLYKAVYPDRNLCNFETHLKTMLHRQNVNARVLGMTPEGEQYLFIRPPAGVSGKVGRVSLPHPSARVSETAPATKRISLPHPLAQVSRAAPVVEQSPVQCGEAESPHLQSAAPKARSLVITLPFAALTGRLSAKSHVAVVSRSQSDLSEPSNPRGPAVDVLENDDRTKRRRLDPANSSTNPLTVKAPDLRTEKYENAKSNDERMVRYYIENVKRLATYQNASQSERDALEEQCRSTYMDARRELGRDAESYARSQGGYDKLTKAWGIPAENSATDANGMRTVECVDERPAVRIRATETKPNTGGVTIQALLRATLRHDEHIELLQKKHDGLLLHTNALEEAQMRCSRLILAAEGKHDDIDSAIIPMNRNVNELKDRIRALEATWRKDSPPSKAMKATHKLATKLGHVETLIQTQERDIADAKQLVHEKAAKLTSSLANISKLHEDITGLQNSTRHSSEWRKQQEVVLKEQKTRIEQLESELRWQREDKQNFKMTIEGRVDALLRHHQENSDAMVEKMNAMEKVVERQSAQIKCLKMRVSPESAHPVHSKQHRKSFD